MRLLLPRTLLAFSGVLLASAVASAAPISITGNAIGSQVSATGELTLAGNLLTLQITNTSSLGGAVTAIGFDLVGGDFSGNSSTGLNTFGGNNPGGFTFSDGQLGQVPQFNSAVLDFGWITKGKFNGGKVDDGLAPSFALTFTATGNFAGFTEAELASALFARFQGLNTTVNDGSDVGQGTTTSSVPEPASLLLLGTGLAAMVARRRKLLKQ